MDRFCRKQGKAAGYYKFELKIPLSYKNGGGETICRHITREALGTDTAESLRLVDCVDLYAVVQADSE